MKNLFIIEYAVYLFMMIDAIPTVGFIKKGTHSQMWILYVVLLFFQLLLVHINYYKNLGYFHIKKIFFVMTPIFITYLLTILAEYTVPSNVFSMLVFIIAIYFTGRLLGEYQCIRKFLIVSYFLPFFYIILHNATNKYSLSTLFQNVNLLTYFSMIYKTRFRFDFGFNNPNTIGNILAYLICISFLLMYYVRTETRRKATILIFIIIDAYCLVMLLITGCRSGIMVIVVFIYTYSHLLFLQNKYLTSRTTLIIKLFYITLLIFLAIFTFNDIAYYYFHSGRQTAFLNLQLLNSVKRKLFGIGLRGDYLQFHIDGNKGSYIDNYYIYILVTSGIVGACFIMFSIINIGKNIYGHITNGKVYLYLFSYYISLLFYGLGEAGVLTPSNIASGVYFSLFIAAFNTKLIVKNAPK